MYLKIGQWFDVSYQSEASSFICSAPRSGSNSSPSALCPNDWFQFFGNCYKFVSQSNSYDQHAAACTTAWTGDKGSNIESIFPILWTIIYGL